MKLQVDIVSPAARARAVAATAAFLLCQMVKIVKAALQEEELLYYDGRIYQVVSDRKSWDEAVMDAAAREQCETNGHLVTITSPEENSFVGFNAFGRSWIGLTDQDNEDEFVWQNNETGDYTNWSDGEPNNEFGEDCVEMSNNGKWNDVPCTLSLSYVVEFDCPIPFFNGHAYQVYSDAQWDVARAAAESEEFCGVQGHLVTITSREENRFVRNQFTATDSPNRPLIDVYIGLGDQAVEGIFAWVTGETSSYTNWASSEPSNGAGENCVELYPGGEWNDIGCTSLRPYVVEFDCQDSLTTTPTTAAPATGAPSTAAPAVNPPSMNEPTKGPTVPPSNTLTIGPTMQPIKGSQLQSSLNIGVIVGGAVAALFIVCLAAVLIAYFNWNKTKTSNQGATQDVDNNDGSPTPVVESNDTPAQMIDPEETLAVQAETVPSDPPATAATPVTAGHLPTYKNQCGDHPQGQSVPWVAAEPAKH